MAHISRVTGGHYTAQAVIYGREKYHVFDTDIGQSLTTCSYQGNVGDCHAVYGAPRGLGGLYNDLITCKEICSGPSDE